MKKEDVENHFIPLLNANEKLISCIHVTIYGMDGNDYPMVFKLWVGKFISSLQAGTTSFMFMDSSGSNIS